MGDPAAPSMAAGPLYDQARGPPNGPSARVAAGFAVRPQRRAAPTSGDGRRPQAGASRLSDALESGGSIKP